MKQLGVLLSAYQCGPGLGSVSQIGWEWYSRLVNHASVTLVTHVRNRAALVSAGAPLGDSKIIYIDTEWFSGPLYRMAKRLFPGSPHSIFLLSSLDFYMYDREVCRQIEAKSGRTWNVIHAVTPVSPAASTRLHRFGVPLIVGPWNGGLASPREFPGIMREDSGWLYPLRSLGRLADRLAGCTREAACILSATEATDKAVGPRCSPRVRRMLENAVDLSLFHPGIALPPPSPVSPLEILYAGRLAPFKGVSLLLEAAARVKDKLAIRVTIAGDGPLREALRNQANRSGLDASFTGATPPRDVAELMRHSHLFCLPSVRESGGAVLLEAMACGLPVAAVKHGGPAELVDEAIGTLLTADGPEALLRDMCRVFTDVYERPDHWRQLGLAGRKRAEANYGWDKKIETALDLYSDLCKKEQTVEKASKHA